MEDSKILSLLHSENGAKIPTFWVAYGNGTKCRDKVHNMVLSYQ